MVSVIGDSGTPEDAPNYRIAHDIGRRLIASGFRVCSGGLTGVMAAVFAGAHSAHNYREGDTVGIIPTLDRAHANARAASIGQSVPVADIMGGAITYYPPGNSAGGPNFDSFAFTVNDGTTDSEDDYTMTINLAERLRLRLRLFLEGPLR